MLVKNVIVYVLTFCEREREGYRRTESVTRGKRKVLLVLVILVAVGK